MLKLGLHQTELLCFVQKRSTTLAFDDPVSVHSGFYTVMARVLLKEYVPEKRLPKQEGAEKTKFERQCLTLRKCAWTQNPT